MHSHARTHALRYKKTCTRVRVVLASRRVRTTDLQIVYQIPLCASDRAATAIGPFDAEIPAEYRGTPRVRSNVHTKRTNTDTDTNTHTRTLAMPNEMKKGDVSVLLCVRLCFSGTRMNRITRDQECTRAYDTFNLTN